MLALLDARKLPGDVSSLRWLRDPAASGRTILAILALYWACDALNVFNPFANLVALQYPLGTRDPADDVPRYGKGLGDLPFLAFYVVVFSCFRQSAIRYIIHPLALFGGIRGERKLERFTEQGYAFLYWSLSSLAGLAVMSKQPTWFYNTKAFWIGYPHWQMRLDLKAYYLLQFAYWLQQLLVLVLKIEKPRSDYMELCCHHVVTMWLIGWSYFLNLTYIGVAVFFSMDIADVFLAISKMLNYMQYQRSSEIAFAVLLCVWTYFRHYQNLRILWSVWTEYDVYVPEEARVFEPLQGRALSWWMKYQVFAPIFALHCLNLFWYCLMWRIVYRILTGSNATDTREEDEVEQESEESEESRVKQSKSE